MLSQDGARSTAPFPHELHVLTAAWRPHHHVCAILSYSNAIEMTTTVCTHAQAAICLVSCMLLGYTASMQQSKYI